MKSSLRTWRGVLPSALLLVVLPILAGCYIPYGYLTKIQLSKDGRYELNFQGHLLSANHLSKLNEGKLESNTEANENEKMVHQSQLVRMGFSNVEYTFPASYSAKLDIKGNLFKERMVSFPGRNGSLLVMKLLKDNVLVVQSQRLNKKYIEQLESSGINFVGDIVIWTDIQISQHNADAIQLGNPDAYVWKMHSLEKAPLQLIGKLGNF